MPGPESTLSVAVGGVRLRLPRTVTRLPGQPVDSAAAVYEGGGVTVIVDSGPFADRLESHVGAPGYAASVQDVAGLPARQVTFTDPDDDTRTTAVHVVAPQPFTVVVRTDASVPPGTAQQIIDSVQWHASRPEGGGPRGHEQAAHRPDDPGTPALDADRGTE